MSKIKETIQNIPAITSVVGKIDTLREYSIKAMAQGKDLPGEVLETIADSMKELGESLPQDSGMAGWDPFLNDVRKGEVPSDFGERLLQWENEVFYYLNCLPLCNICKEREPYLPKTIYYRQKQKEHGFPYWNAVMESISHKSCMCPKCHSLDRERMISLFLDMLSAGDAGEKLRVLQIAPAPALDRYLRAKDSVEYDTTDLFMPNVSFRADIQNMDMVKDKTYDVIICSHILEHVEDDRKAMRELHRILKDDGVCLFLVPLVIGLDKTDEAFGLSEDENWKRFGQNDHARLYAKEDFLNRLSEAGFLVYSLKEDYFGAELWRQNGLSDIHCLYAATKQDIGLGIEPYRPIDHTKQELISVVIPTHNRGFCIEESVRSVLEQTYRNIEVIVVDDGSTDQTEVVVGGIDDPRLRYVKLEENKGANYARNVGINNAAGDYIAFNDSDDLWLPEKLEKQMKLMRLEDNEQLGCVYCAVTKYQNGKILTIAPNMEKVGENAIGNLRDYMLGHMFISTQSLLVKKSVLEDVGGFREELKRLQDWELLLRISGKYKFTLVQENLVDAYVRGDCVSNNNTNVRGFVDTVRYVVDLYDCRHKYVEQYCGLMEVCVTLLADSKDPHLTVSYCEMFVDKLREDGIFTDLAIEEIRKRLKLSRNGADTRGGVLTGSLSSDTEIGALQTRVEALSCAVEENNRILKELLWAQVFSSARGAFQWLPERTALWPGRFGVGYQYMYVVSRLLNEVRPKRILETGLGQSTRLIGSYVKWMEKQEPLEHIVIEHDQSWIDVFRDDFAIGASTKICQRDLMQTQITHPESQNVRATWMYRDLAAVLQGKKFDFISLDGPYGTNDPYGFSRVDILHFIPECLEKSFCIVMDDFERYGEKNTVGCIKAILRENGIAYAETVYRGEQDMYLIMSTDLKYLCTL